MPPDFAVARRDRAAQADERLSGLFDAALSASGASTPMGLAVVATGGYGRSELSPASDLDVVLVHAPALDPTMVSAVAEAIWYPLWDEGVALDHAVRDTGLMRRTAADDDRAAMGLLDARTVAGDGAMVHALRSEVLTDWRRDARRRIEQVRSTRAERIERAGSLAHAAVPDLKESAGGLRDGVVLRALVATWLIDVPSAESERLRHALLDVRDALHTVTGRRTERLDAAFVADIAHLLDMTATELDLHTRDLGRRMEHLCAMAWRRVDAALVPEHRRRITGRGPVTTPLAEGVALLDGEVIVARRARPDTDPEVALRAAALAARSGRLLEPSTAARLARTMGDLPVPWPRSTTRWLVDLLTAGEGLVPVWNELDIAGVIDLILPEWSDIRLRGSSSPVHRFTIDRHSLETVVRAGTVARDVDRPDLLAVAALLHDIGKGREGDHSETGAPLAVEIARRWGFEETDATLVGRLVRHHLLLPDTATRRDIEDPATAQGVADLVGDIETLELLAALTSADARATSDQAWTSWRRGLVEGLVTKTRVVLNAWSIESGPVLPRSDYEGWPAEVPWPDLSGLDDPERPQGDLVLQVEPHRDGSLLTIATRDRHGVMADLAGGLTLAGLSVRSARTVTVDASSSAPGDSAISVSLWEVTRPGVDAAVLAPRLRQALSGELDLARRFVQPDGGDRPVVRAVPSRSATATVIEIRARDRRGLLWSICRTIADHGVGIRSAHLSTYGNEARDTFYVVDAAGGPLPAQAAQTLAGSVAAALSG